MRNMLRSIIVVACVGVLWLCMGIAVEVECYAQEATADLTVVTTGTAGIAANVKKIDGTTQPDGKIYWTANASLSPSATPTWIVANQYIELSFTNVPPYTNISPFWGIQMYTDNKSATAVPRFTGIATRDPAGLVDTNKTDGFVLPVAWIISNKSLSSAELDDPETYKPQEVKRADGTVGFDDFLWHYLVDKNTPDDPLTAIDETFSNAKDYIVLWNQKGIAWNEGGRASRPQKAYIYLAAKFDAAYAGALYKTSVLTLEQYHDVDPFPIYVYKDASKTDPEHANDSNATLENHYAPAFMNFDNNNTPTNTADDNIILTEDYTTSPYSGAYCMKVYWNGKGTDYNNDGDYLDPGESPGWAGAMWLEPPPATDGTWPNPGAGVGYDLRATRRGLLRFYAKASRAGCSINVHFGRTGDSCGQVPVISENWVPITTSWATYIIDIPETKDMSSVSAGFSVVLNDTHDGISGSPGYTVYLDDVRYELWPT